VAHGAGADLALEGKAPHVCTRRPGWDSGRVDAHIFRHTFADLWLTVGGGEGNLMQDAG